MSLKIVHVVGARPNFVKMAPVIRAVDRLDAVTSVVVHTGQHYDERMSTEMLHDLDFPAPDRFLGVGSGSHGEQTAKVLAGFEQVLFEERPDLVLVAGDVNSTLAAALAAAKLSIPIAHLEAGLRSFDWGMPEEINRVLTDRLSDVLLTHSPEATPNLEREGIDPARIHFVGNTMIDSLRRFEGRARERETWKGLGLEDGGYFLVTLHRPSNVDLPEQLNRVVDALLDLATRAPVVFPIHPRTRARLSDAQRLDTMAANGIQCLEPIGYLDFLALETAAGAIVTDSGGIQEEASALGVPCYTLRPNTERPVTVSLGTNVMLGDDPLRIAEAQLRDGACEPCQIPLWDGKAAERVAAVLEAGLAEQTLLLTPA